MVSSSSRRLDKKFEREGVQTMKRKMKIVLGASMLAAMAWTIGTPATAADEKINLKVVGSWGNLNNWIKIEKPFWTEQLKALSGGKITADATPMTEIGLKGFEIMRLLQQGVFHVGHGVISYLNDDPVAEGGVGILCPRGRARREQARRQRDPA